MTNRKTKIKAGMFGMLITAYPLLTACHLERFRHETYSCNAPVFAPEIAARIDIAEIVVQHPQVGKSVQIIGFETQRQGEITALTHQNISIKTPDKTLMIDRETGLLWVEMDGTTHKVMCKASVFTL